MAQVLVAVLGSRFCTSCNGRGRVEWGGIKARGATRAWMECPACEGTGDIPADYLIAVAENSEDMDSFEEMLQEERGN